MFIISIMFSGATFIPGAKSIPYSRVGNDWFRLFFSFNSPKLTSFFIKVCYKLSGWVTKERLTNIMAMRWLSD